MTVPDAKIIVIPGTNGGSMASWHDDFAVGEWLVRPKLDTVFKSGRPTRLKHKSMQVLTCLADADGDVVSRNDIMDAVWPGMVVTDDVLTQSIVELRRAFGDDAKNSRYIETIPKIGFRLVAAVSPAEAPTPRRPLEHLVGRRILLVSIAVSAGLAWAMWNFIGDSARNSVIEVDAARSIAVLPFVNLTSDPGQDWLSDGIAVEILNDLGQIPGLSLVGRKSSFRFRGDDRDLREVGNALGVNIILEGTLRREGDLLRIGAQLVSVADGFEIWSGSYDRKLDDVLRTQDDIARAVVQALEPHLGIDGNKDRPVRIQTTSDAYAEYLQGIYFIDRTFSPGQEDTNLDAARMALAHMQRATELAPEFAMAWAGRARAQIWHTQLSGEPWDEVEAQIEEWLTKALMLGRDIAEVQFAAARWYESDRATSHLLRAIEINANYAEAYADLALNLRANGNYSEYFVTAAKAADLDPLDNWSNWIALYAAFHRGEHASIDRLIRDNRQLWPSANALADEIHLRFELGQLEYWPEFHRRADALSPQWGIEPPHWITGPPRYLGDGYLTLDLVEPAHRFLGWRYKDVIDLYNGDASAAITFLSGELEKSRNAAPFYYRTFIDIASSLVQSHLYAANYSDIVDIVDGLDISPELFALPSPERTNPPWPQLAYVYAQFQLGNAGVAEEWLNALAKALERRHEQGVSLPNHYFELARIRALQDRHSEALEALRQAIDMGWRRWYFDRDPILEPVRQLPEFAALKQRYDADLENQRQLVVELLAK